MDGVSVPVIVGPTASGKTSLALWLAERDDLLVISGDSRQVYRGFDIGTGKPAPSERAGVPHRGIDVADPSERFSASRWAALAEAWIGEARAAGLYPLVVGGTGFWLRALFEPLFAEPSLDPVAREDVERELATVETERLRERVRGVDPARAHLGRSQLLRALEIHMLTGVAISTWHRTAARAPRFRPRYLVADSPGTLDERIRRRVAEMADAGWLNEVRSLVERVAADAPAWSATGYGEMRRVVVEGLPVDEAQRQVAAATRRYARRQRTWCRHQLPARLVTHLDTDAAGSREAALQWWQQGERA